MLTPLQTSARAGVVAIVTSARTEAIVDGRNMCCDRSCAPVRSFQCDEILRGAAAEREDRQLGAAQEAERDDAGADAARDVDGAERGVVPARAEAARAARDHRRASGAADLSAVRV